MSSDQFKTIAWGDSLNVFVQKHVVNYHVLSIKENAWGKSDIPAECFGFTLKTICSWWFSLNPGHFMKIYVFAFHKGTLSQSRSLQRRTLQRILAIIHVGCLCKCCVHMWESLMRAPETSAIWDVTRRQWLFPFACDCLSRLLGEKNTKQKTSFLFLGFHALCISPSTSQSKCFYSVAHLALSCPRPRIPLSIGI